MYPGSMTRVTDATIASTASVVVTADITKVTGTTSIATISRPVGGFSAVIGLIPVDDTVSTLTTGNIAIAVTMPQNRVTFLVYNQASDVWYPGAIS